MAGHAAGVPRVRRPTRDRGFLWTGARWRGRRRLRLLPTRANTQPAFGCDLIHPDAPTAVSAGILVLTLSGDGISTITRFLDQDLHRIFVLADAAHEAAQPPKGSISSPGW